MNALKSTVLILASRQIPILGILEEGRRVSALNMAGSENEHCGHAVCPLSFELSVVLPLNPQGIPS